MHRNLDFSDGSWRQIVASDDLDDVVVDRLPVLSRLGYDLLSWNAQNGCRLECHDVVVLVEWLSGRQDRVGLRYGIQKLLSQMLMHRGRSYHRLKFRQFLVYFQDFTLNNT